MLYHLVTLGNNNRSIGFAPFHLDVAESWILVAMTSTCQALRLAGTVVPAAEMREANTTHGPIALRLHLASAAGKTGEKHGEDKVYSECCGAGDASLRESADVDALLGWDELGEFVFFSP